MLCWCSIPALLLQRERQTHTHTQSRTEEGSEPVEAHSGCYVKVTWRNMRSAVMTALAASVKPSCWLFESRNFTPALVIVYIYFRQTRPLIETDFNVADKHAYDICSYKKKNHIKKHFFLMYFQFSLIVIPSYSMWAQSYFWPFPGDVVICLVESEKRTHCSAPVFHLLSYSSHSP